MAQFSTKLRIVSLVLALTIISLGDLYGADWKLLSKSKIGSVYYDRDSLTRPVNDIVRAWVLVYPFEKLISSVEVLFGERFEALGYWLELVDIHCRKGNIRFISLQCYSSDGVYIGSFFRQFPTPWEKVEPSYILGTQLLEGFCK